PGNLQEIMNRVLAAERMSQAQLVEARTKAEVQRIEAAARTETQRREAETRAEASRLAAQADADAIRFKAEAEVQSLRHRAPPASTCRAQPALLRLTELETLRALASSANARIYIGFDKHARLTAQPSGEDAEPR